MLSRGIITRYLFKEMLPPFFVSLGVFTFLLLVARIMRLTDLVVSRGVSLADVGRLLMYTLPYFFVFTIPMATLLAVLLAFLRLSADNEITAIKSAGVGLHQLLPPVAAMALMAWLISSILAIWILPWSNHQFENLIFKLARTQGDLVLRERVFMNSFKGLVIYINRLPGQGSMEKLFIVDQREKDRSHTIVAKRGQLFPSPGNKLTLRLYDGTIHGVGKHLRTAQTLSFSTYDLPLDTSRLSTARRSGKREREMTPGELWAELDKHPKGSPRYISVQIELLRKFTVPFACLVMALIGVPLGVHSRSGRSWGVVLAMLLFFAYYMMFSAAISLGETGIYPPWLGMWMPNVVFGLLGVIMFRREMLEKQLGILDTMGSLPALASRLWARRRRWKIS